MEKVKIDPKKIIKVRPQMIKDTTGAEMLIAMIIGILLGMVLISLF